MVLPKHLKFEEQRRPDLASPVKVECNRHSKCLALKEVKDNLKPSDAVRAAIFGQEAIDDELQALDLNG